MSPREVRRWVFETLTDCWLITGVVIGFGAHALLRRGR